MAEEGDFGWLKGGRMAFNIIISGLLLIVVIAYVMYYLYVSSVLENLILLQSYLNVTEKPFLSFGSTTTAEVDAKYLATVTLTTVGYGDATPASEDVQIMMCLQVVFFGGIMTKMLFYTVDMFVDRVVLYRLRRNSVLKLLFFDGGIICSLVKIVMACLLIVSQIYIGVWVIKAYEVPDKDKDKYWFDPYYLSIISASTVGYGDKIFKTKSGRIFAATWLFIAVYCVDKGLCMLAEIFPDWVVRLCTYFFSRKTNEANPVSPLRSHNPVELEQRNCN